MRVLTILSAYVGANLAAGIVLLAELLVATSFLGAGVEASDPPGAILLFGVIIPALLIAVFTILPALAVITYSERQRVQSPVFYAVAGAAIGIASFGVYVLLLIKSEANLARLAEDASFSEMGLVNSLVILVASALFGASGCAGGFTYWLIAVRNVRWPPSKIPHADEVIE